MKTPIDIYFSTPHEDKYGRWIVLKINTYEHGCKGASVVAAGTQEACIAARKLLVSK